MGTMTSLEQVRAALIAELGGTERLKLVNARLILRTGINLQEINPQESRSMDKVANATFALRKMGFKL